MLNKAKLGIKKVDSEELSDLSQRCNKIFGYVSNFFFNVSLYIFLNRFRIYCIIIISNIICIYVYKKWERGCLVIMKWSDDTEYFIISRILLQSSVNLSYDFLAFPWDTVLNSVLIPGCLRSGWDKILLSIFSSEFYKIHINYKVPLAVVLTTSVQSWRFIQNCWGVKILCF